MQNKKGLSDVVTNVLLILLVIVAIGIIWAFVGPMIMGGGSKVQAGAACLDISLDIPKCQFNATDKGSLNVTVHRSSGQVDLNKVKIIFIRSDGSSDIKEETTIPAELGNAVYYYANAKLYSKVSVAAGIKDATSGKVNYCREISSVDCIV